MKNSKPRGSNTSRDMRLSSSRTSYPDDSHSLTKEIETLKRLLKDAHKELHYLKQTHDQEVKFLKDSFENVKQQVEELKAEKQETLALQSYGIDEYSQLAQEVIKLRTEVDRLRYLYDKEKRKNVGLELIYKDV